MRLVVGSPAGRPTPRQVAAALAELGVAADPRRRSRRSRTAARRGCWRHTADGDLHVRVYGRDAAETAPRGEGVAVRRLQGLRADPDLHAPPAGRARGAVPAPVEGRRRARARPRGGRRRRTVGRGARDPATRSSPAPSSTRRRRAGVRGRGRSPRLRAARIAHGAPRCRGPRRTGDGAVLVITDFSVASISGRRDRLDADVAQLLVTTAALVGAPRAVEVAVAAVGVDGVGDVGRFLSRSPPSPRRNNGRCGRAQVAARETHAGGDRGAPGAGVRAADRAAAGQTAQHRDVRGLRLRPLGDPRPGRQPLRAVGDAEDRAAPVDGRWGSSRPRRPRSRSPR